MNKTLTFTSQVFKDGKQYVSFNPELEVASCGDSPEDAKNNLKEAIEGFIAVATQEGTLDSILESAGYVKVKKSWRDPYLVSMDRLSVSV